MKGRKRPIIWPIDNFQKKNDKSMEIVHDPTKKCCISTKGSNDCAKAKKKL